MSISILYICIEREREKERHVHILCCELRLPKDCSNNIHAIQRHNYGRFLPLVEVDLNDLRFYDMYIYNVRQ